MIKSMTGFGQGSFESESGRITVDIKTVNNRFLDIHLKMPTEMAALENGLRKRVQSVLKRGRADILVTLVQTAEIAFEINMPLVKGYIHALQHIQKELALENSTIDLNVLLAKLPGAIQASTDLTNVDERWAAGLMSALDQALNALVVMRSNEGEELANELHRRLDIIANNLPPIIANTSQLAPLYQERLQKRMQEMLRTTGATIDEARLAQEVAYLAERSDIAEEIARLKSHIIQFRELLNAGEEAGKKFDFLLQEMNREANTILSKSGELSIAKLALEIKSEIEKLREQVQNVE